jgi:hypothetical protein
MDAIGRFSKAGMLAKRPGKTRKEQEAILMWLSNQLWVSAWLE